ncbi:MAG: flagellar export protein FliJ [Planctomycetes bacterium RBG_13_44_8b]|nr:MAG: flagellar export protein FliJ [Planctomycetes bacterium RBG_13_44_8b]
MILWAAVFNFKLQSILNVRKTQEDKLLQEFSERQKELRKEHEHLKSIQQEKMLLIDELRNVQGKTVNVTEIAMNTDGIKRYQKSETLQKEQVREAQKKVEEKREALFEAIKKRKTMEILKSKQFELHQSEANLLERTAIDEMAIVRHNRRERE